MRVTRSGDRAIKRYLSRISSARRGSPAQETEQIIQSVRDHIFESLRQLGREEVDASAVREVLAGMASAASYGAEAGDTEEHKVRSRRTAALAYAGLACLAAAVFIPLLTLLVLAIVQPRGSNALAVSLAVAAVLLVAAILLGALGFRHPAGKAALFCSLAILLAAGSLLAVTGRSISAPQQPVVEEIPAQR
jgi:hypothetical protein